MGYETPGYISVRLLEHINDEGFKRCLAYALEDQQVPISVNLFELLDWLEIYGIYEQFGEEVCKIHSNMGRPTEVKEQFKNKLQMIIQYM